MKFYTGVLLLCQGNSDFVKMKQKLQANYMKTYLHFTNLVTNITLLPTMPVFLWLQWLLALPLIFWLQGYITSYPCYQLLWLHEHATNVMLHTHLQSC
jgi:hypothetical protein